MHRTFSLFAWVKLRALGNSRAVQASAAFPFVGYWILFNDQVSSFLNVSQLETKSVLPTWLEMVWATKLYFLYFGLLLLGIGSFIYQAACPYIIKKYADWADYVRAEAGVVHSHQISALEGILNLPTHTTATLSWDHRKALVMQQWYADQSNRNAMLRLLVGLLFYAGLLLLTLPSAISLIKIVLLFVSKIHL